jgi:hypothetical protein
MLDLEYQILFFFDVTLNNTVMQMQTKFKLLKACSITL